MTVPGVPTNEVQLYLLNYLFYIFMKMEIFRSQGISGYFPVLRSTVYRHTGTETGTKVGAAVCNRRGEVGAFVGVTSDACSVAKLTLFESSSRGP